MHLSLVVAEIVVTSNARSVGGSSAACSRRVLLCTVLNFFKLVGSHGAVLGLASQSWVGCVLARGCRQLVQILHSPQANKVVVTELLLVVILHPAHSKFNPGALSLGKLDVNIWHLYNILSLKSTSKSIIYYVKPPAHVISCTSM